VILSIRNWQDEFDHCNLANMTLNFQNWMSCTLHSYIYCLPLNLTINALYKHVLFSQHPAHASLYLNYIPTHYQPRSPTLHSLPSQPKFLLHFSTLLIPCPILAQILQSLQYNLTRPRTMRSPFDPNFLFTVKLLPSHRACSIAIFASQQFLFLIQP
jgi:hypothetical protein